jgi:hypothetical protein
MKSDNDKKYDLEAQTFVFVKNVIGLLICINHCMAQKNILNLVYYLINKEA